MINLAWVVVAVVVVGCTAVVVAGEDNFLQTAGLEHTSVVAGQAWDTGRVAELPADRAVALAWGTAADTADQVSVVMGWHRTSWRAVVESDFVPVAWPFERDVGIGELKLVRAGLEAEKKQATVG